MRKGLTKITIAIMVGIVIVVGLATTLTILTLQKPKVESPNIVADRTDIKVVEGEMTEYSSEKLGVKFKYLKEFTRFSEELDSSICQTAAMYNPITTEGLNLIIGELPDETNLQNNLNMLIDNISQTNNIKKSEITVVKESKIAGVVAAKYLYKAGDSNLYQCILLKDKKQYVLTYSKKGNDFDPARGDYFFSTFEFLT